MKCVGRFAKDESGAVPMEVWAVTGSLILFGATVLETRPVVVSDQGTTVQEEVFVRKCGRRVSVVGPITLQMTDSSDSCTR
jgi:hypothetical protein